MAQLLREEGGGGVTGRAPKIKEFKFEEKNSETIVATKLEGGWVGIGKALVAGPL